MTTSNELKRAWNERVGETTAHLHFDPKYLPENLTKEQYKKTVDLIGGKTDKKVIIDYGCGGGLFGQFLDCQYKRYIGLDISQRSIDWARKNNPKGDYRLIEPFNFADTGQIKADIFVCLSVIQHFPNEQYLIDFLDMINKAGWKKVILQVRYGIATKFEPNEYLTTKEINNACWTNAEYIQNKLSNYRLKAKTEQKENTYNYMRFDIV